MSKHIQPISHYPPHERIKTFLIKRNNSHSNLTEGSAQSRLGAEVDSQWIEPSMQVDLMWYTMLILCCLLVVEEGAKASRIIMWLLYLCTKPETSEM